MKRRLGRFSRNESGETAVDYCLLVALIGFFIVASLDEQGHILAARFDKVSATLASAVGLSRTIESQSLDQGGCAPSGKEEITPCLANHCGNGALPPC